MRWGSADQPCLLLLDDCQWADDLSLKLIQFWQHHAGAQLESPRYVMLVVAYRSEESARWPPPAPLAAL